MRRPLPLTRRGRRRRPACRRSRRPRRRGRLVPATAARAPSPAPRGRGHVLLHQARWLPRAPSAAAVSTLVRLAGRRGRCATAPRSHQRRRRPRLVEHLGPSGVAESASAAARGRLVVSLGGWRGSFAQLSHQRQILKQFGFT